MKRCFLMMLFSLLIAGFLCGPVYAATEAADEAVRSGWVTEGKNTYYYKAGKRVKGWQKIKKKWYYFDKKTKTMAKNCIAGNKTDGWYYVGSDGIRCKDKTMKLAVEVVRNHTKKKDSPKKRLIACFKYFVKKYRYRSGGYAVSVKDLPKYAKEFLVSKSGNCYRGAAALAYCAKALGFSSRIGVGSKYKNRILHGWTEIKVDDAWYYFDINRQRMNPKMDLYMISVKKKPFKVMKMDGWKLTVKEGKVVWK